MADRQDRYENRGVHITGGTISGQVAGGQNAKVSQTQNVGIASPEIADALLRLERLLDHHADALEHGTEAEEDLADVRAQLEREHPDRDRISDTLVRLTRRVSSVGGLVSAVEQLKAAIFG